jgi:hypothetical protein
MLQGLVIFGSKVLKPHSSFACIFLGKMSPHFCKESISHSSNFTPVCPVAVIFQHTFYQVIEGYSKRYQ